MSSIIKEKYMLNDDVCKMVIKNERIAKKALPGEFVILRVCDGGERIPLTISDYDSINETITIIFQIVGLTTFKLNELKVGDEILDLVGPLGKPSELPTSKKVIVVGGGVGSAIAYPICKGLMKNNCQVDAIIGFRNKDLVILEDEFKECSNTLNITTDDGSYKTKGYVTDVLRNLLQNDKYDCVFAIGPVIMMKNVTEITRLYNVKTIVSMNPIMIDGTGMCGCCRLTVDGKMKFACVDGPDFDAFKVDFDELMIRNNYYKNIEKKKRDEHCNLLKKGGNNENN